MDQIKITLPEVTNTAAQIRSLNTSLEDNLNYVKNLMTELNSVWLSEGSETLLGRFNKFATKFVDESETIESYAKFLDFTVSSYDSLESTITSNASNFN